MRARRPSTIDERALPALLPGPAEGAQSILHASISHVTVSGKTRSVPALIFPTAASTARSLSSFPLYSRSIVLNEAAKLLQVATWIGSVRIC
jgi:hypothetical protein